MESGSIEINLTDGQVQERLDRLGALAETTARQMVEAGNETGLLDVQAGDLLILVELFNQNSTQLALREGFMKIMGFCFEYVQDQIFRAHDANQSDGSRNIALDYFREVQRVTGIEMKEGFNKTPNK
jgi:hypothetical protein